MPSILMTCMNDDAPGGVQLIFRHLVESLERQGWGVHLLYGASYRHPGLVHTTNSWGHPAFCCPLPAIRPDRVFGTALLLLGYLPLTLFHLLRLIRRQKIDVINCHYLHAYFIHFVIAARLLRVPLIVSVHGADVDSYAYAGRLERLILRQVMRGACQIVACSRAMAARTAHVFPSVRGKVTHVHNGLILSDFTDTSTPPPMMTPFVLSVCRQVEKKGTDTLLRAFALVQRTFPDLSLVIIGDGPVLDQNKALACRLGIDKKVHFLGDLPRLEVLPFFAACSLFVLPSRAEPFGLVLLEAAYYKRGIVGTRVGGIPEIITDGIDGFLVDPDDPPLMAEKMTALLSDPSLAAQFGARAHRTLITRFLWEDRAQDYVAIYQAALNGAGDSSGT